MYLGIDLGGTKIEVAVLTGRGDIAFRHRVVSPGNDYAAILQAVVALVALAEAAVGPGNTVGIGTPGSASLRDGRMKNCNSTCLNGRFLQRDLEAALGRPIRIANDANCFALSEAVDGAAAGRAVAFGAILGTGVGGGVVVHNRLLCGPSGIGSEWGHNVLPGVGVQFENQHRRCYCGNENCIETYLSGPGFARTYELAGGQALPAEVIAALAKQGDALALSSLAIYQQQLAYALSQVINILDPDVIVLGGGVSNIASLYQTVPALWSQTVFSDTVAVSLLPAQYGDSSGVRGAAWLWRELV